MQADQFIFHKKSFKTAMIWNLKSEYLFTTFNLWSPKWGEWTVSAQYRNMQASASSQGISQTSEIAKLISKRKLNQVNVPERRFKYQHAIFSLMLYYVSVSLVNFSKQCIFDCSIHSTKWDDIMHVKKLYTHIPVVECVWFRPRYKVKCKHALK
jgi:hypothetical protein